MRKPAYAGFFLRKERKMDFKTELMSFRLSHPLKEMDVDGHLFHYLLCGQGESPLTLVYFVGGTGNPLGWYRHVLSMEGKYRVLILDYPMGIDQMEPMTEWIEKLLNRLEISEAVFIGASFGGYIAQLMARRCPEKTKALALYATTALTEEGIADLKKQYRYVGRLLFMMEHMPYGLLKALLMKPSFRRLIPKGDSSQTEYLKGFTQWIYDDYTKEKDLHMTYLMADIVNLKPVKQEDFSDLRGKVLLVLPKADQAFTPKMQKDLQDLFENPTVETLEGGHLATLFRAEEIARRTDRFLTNCI